MTRGRPIVVIGEDRTIDRAAPAITYGPRPPFVRAEARRPARRCPSGMTSRRRTAVVSLALAVGVLAGWCTMRFDEWTSADRPPPSAPRASTEVDGAPLAP